MAEIRATPQQRAAAEDRGGALLVAAAAGSGKTKVLVDRLMGYLTDPTDPADLDEFLIITYTRAAASELRGKIAARIAEALAGTPNDRHLQRQLTRVYLAQISTVHSFCQAVLRQYAAEANLPADFRVADEQQAAALRAQTLRDVLSELYAKLDDEPDFAAMIDTLGYGRDDRRLLELAERSYEVMRCKVDPEAWMADCLRAYALPEGTPAEQTLWGAYYLKARRDALESADAMLAQAEALCRADAALEQKCLPLLQKNRETVHALMAETTWDGCVEAGLPSFGVMRMPKGFKRRERYIAVASPSVSGFVARMTSSTPPCATRSRSSRMRRSSGPTRFIGERAPWSTWYTPWYSRLRSMLSTSRGSDTTQIVVLSRLSDAHTGQSSPSVRFWHTGQVWTLFFASSTALAKRSASSCGSEST